MSLLRLENVPLYFGGTVALLVLKIIFTAIYNVYFHPLRKCKLPPTLQDAHCLRKYLDPGPKLASATGIVWAYYLYQGEEVAWTHKCHQKYGEVVRIGPDRLSYVTAQAWKDIIGFRTGGRLENSKDERAGLQEGPGSVPSILNINDPHDHGRIRKVFTNAFSDKALKLQEPLISTHINKLIQNMYHTVSENPDAHLEMVRLYNCTTFDIMGDLAFGEPLGMLDTGEYTPWVKAVFEGLKFGTYVRIAREYPWINSIMEALAPQTLRDAQALHFDHSVERVNRRMERGDDPSKADIWKLVLSKGSEVLNPKEMHSNASVFMLAGTETTATLLSGATFHMLKNPSKMQRLIEEVRALSADQLTFEALARLPYLNACLEEALRYYPPAPSLLPRIVAPGGNAINGTWVPEGVSNDRIHE